MGVGWWKKETENSEMGASRWRQVTVISPRIVAGWILQK
jgi:hypothetical protein